MTTTMEIMMMKNIMMMTMGFMMSMMTVRQLEKPVGPSVSVGPDPCIIC